MERIFLDYNASTPIAPAVREAMLPCFDDGCGNPSATHWAGASARAALDKARRQVAGLIGAHDDEIVFTSGGTEANNHAITGVFFANMGRRVHIVISAVEHAAIVEPARFLERLGARLTVVPVDSWGTVDPEDIAAAITPDTLLVSVMHANNETGTIQPIGRISGICRERGVLLHTDATQSVGKLPVDVDRLGVDLLSLAGHKLYALKGVGALYIRRGVTLDPFMRGAGHESGRRAGTENVVLDVGLGAAAELAADRSWVPGVTALRDRLWAGLRRAFGGGVVLNGHPHDRLPNTLNVSFAGHTGADVLAAVPEVAASTSATWHSGEVRLSPALTAMGATPAVNIGAVRFSLGRGTTAAQIDRAVALLSERVRSEEQSAPAA